MSPTIRPRLLASRGRLQVMRSAGLVTLVLVGGAVPVRSQPHTTAFCSLPRVPIPDNDPSGVTDQQTRDLSAPISDLDVLLTAEHLRVGDLRFDLTHLATGTAVTLIDRPGYPDTPDGCTADDIDVNLSDEAGSPVESACSVADPAAIFGGHRPEEPLAAFDGESLLGSWALRASDHNVGAAGVLWNFSLIPSLSSTSFDVLNSFYPAGLVIPDADPDGMIHITSIGTRIADLDVRMIATHTWVGDLVMSLEHLGTGTKVKLLDRILGCGGDDINATFDDEAATPAGASCNATPPAVSGFVQPAESLASFDGESTSGIWKLTVSDESFGDTGTLTGWCLVVEWDLLFSDGFETGGLDGWQ